MDLANDLTHAWRIHDAERGVDISTKLAPYLTRITVRDQPGRKADEAILELSAGKKLQFPKFSKSLRIFLGASMRNLVDLGKYYVTDFALTGPPDLMLVTCRPMYFGGGSDITGTSGAGYFSDTTSRKVWSKTTLGAIAQEIANKFGFDLAIAPDFAAAPIDTLEQNDENDLAFLSRIASDYGGVAKVSSNTLALGSLHTQDSLRLGKTLPTVTTTPDDVSAYDLSWSARDAPGKIRAHWYDPRVGFGGDSVFGDGDTVIDLPRQYPSQEVADRAVFASYQLREEMKRFARLTYTKMQSDIWVGSKIKLGPRWHKEIRGVWSVVAVEHTLSADGSYTVCNAEQK